MIQCKTRLISWGNSVGVAIPKAKLAKEHLSIDEKVQVVIRPVSSIKVKDLYGAVKQWKKPTRQIMKEVDEDLDTER
jgi:antitoxin component of MazEF toxin-antitoxin module